MPLTVVQILPALDVGGVERGTLEIASALVRNGHRSIVISGGGRLVKQLVNEGSEHITLPVGKKSLLTLLLISRLKKILINENVSVIHSRSRLPAWISYLAWRSMDAQHRPHFVTTVHGPYTVNRYSRIMVRGERVIAISEFIRDHILQNYPDTDPNSIEVIHRGVSSDQFPHGFRPAQGWLANWQQAYPGLNGKFVVALTARITRWKGQEDFIEIVNSAVARGLPVHGLVAGAPHQNKTAFYDQLRNMVKNRNLDNHITFLGHRDDLKEIMAISNVVFSLAREPEAFGRTALEALCLGTPVIAYDHGGAAEVMQAIFPEGCIKPLDIIAAVTRLEEFYRTRPIVPQNNPFTLAQMQNKTINLYESLSQVTSRT